MLSLVSTTAQAQTSLSAAVDGELAYPEAVAVRDSAAHEAKVTFRLEDHPTLRVGHVRVAFRAHVAADLQHSDARIPDEGESLDIARRRIGIEGQIGRLFGFQVERELFNDDPWRDVYVDYRQFRAVQAQAGRFKLPFSLEETTSASHLDFIYRSLAATRLAPGRDRGVMTHGQVLNRLVRYEIGLFQHDGDNSRPHDPDRVFGDRTFAMRVAAVPFRTFHGPLNDLRIGFAMTQGTLNGSIEGRPGLQGRMSMGGHFFDRDIWIKGTRARRGVEARWRAGPASVAAEYIRVTDQRLGQSVEETDLSPLLATGWYVSGTLALTGEHKAAGLNAPRRPFGGDGIGAVEVAVRLENLSFGSIATNETPSASPRANVIAGNADRAVTYGVNWYPSRWVKVQFNVIREQLSDPLQGPSPSQSVIWGQVLRLHVLL